MLSESQKLLLTLVAEKDGKLNWYKVSRVYINKFSSPSELSESFSYLENERLIESKTIGDEPLPRLFLTDKGKAQIDR